MTKNRREKFPWRNFILWIVGAIAVIMIFGVISGRFAEEETIEKSEITFTQFMNDLEADKVESVTFNEKTPKNVEGKYRELYEGKEHRFSLILPFTPDSEFIEKVREYDVTIETKENKKSTLRQIVGWLPTIVIILIVAIFIWLILRGKNPASRLQDTKKGSRSFAPGRHKIQTEVPRERFSDVAGIDEVKYELNEVVDFLKFPERFESVGAEIPRGVLLSGSPGTGKTLLARAVAGEAGVPFLHMSGSEFVEMFVGVGAGRVRALFTDAKRVAPCIVFIDEIDAVGRHRGSGIGGGHDEREQTLNQLLSEMDGFEPNTGVVVVAATNRLDILDPALLRPGRFDRRVIVPLPRKNGRFEILKIHTRGKPLSRDVDLGELARVTPWFSGADLRNLANEAAIQAARNGRIEITMQDFREARMRVLVGPTRKDQPSEKDKEVAAYHEAGHAVVAFLLPEVPRLEQISIISRGMTGGMTEAVPEEENLIVRKSQLIGQIKFALGGRVAEEIAFGEPSTGAEDDLNKVTQITQRMILHWGMSDRFAPRTFGRGSGHIFLGKDMHGVQDYSDRKQAEIDEEVEKIILDALESVRLLLESNKDRVERLAQALLEREELSGREVEELFAS